MEINYELTPEDYFQFSKENAPSQSTHKPLVTFFMLVYLLFIFADVLYAVFFGSLKDLDFGAFLLSIGLRTIITFGAILFILGAVKIYAKLKAKKFSQEPKNGLFCEHRIILTEKELIELTDVNTARYSWKAIGEAKELESFITINVLMSSFYVIPKRYFQDRAQINQFLETINQHQHNAKNTFQLSHFAEYEKSLE